MTTPPMKIMATMTRQITGGDAGELRPSVNNGEGVDEVAKRDRLGNIMHVKR